MNIEPYKTGFSNICYGCDHVHYTLFVQGRLVAAYCMGNLGCTCNEYTEKPVVRPSWDETWMKVADAMAERATCPRLSVGAVVVKENHLLASGFNGAVRGADHCVDVGCTIQKDHCVKAVHAEANCVAEAGRHGVSLVDATIYCRHGFCVRCASLLIQAGIKEAVYVEMYSNGTDGVFDLLIDAGVKVRQINV